MKTKKPTRPEWDVKQLSPMKQEAVKRLEKLRAFVLEKVYSGYEDIYYKPAIDNMLDAISEAKQCLTHGYNKDGTAV